MFGVTHIPTSAFNAVGVTSSGAQVTPPTVISGQPALANGKKVVVLWVGAEYCPYCAAERWGLAAALARFGTVSGLRGTTSALTDIFPGMSALTFAHTVLASRFAVFEPVEIQNNRLNATGTGYQTFQLLTPAQTKLVNTYDTSQWAGPHAQPGSIPFIDIGNRVLVSGASFSPSILQGLSRQQIVELLRNPSNPVAQAILATANYLSAAICLGDGQRPGSVCASPGVLAAIRAETSGT